MATHTIIECHRCRQPFAVVASRATKAKYCSKACYFPVRQDRPCAICSRPIPKSRLWDSRATYCSPKCSSVAVSQKGAFHAPPDVRFREKLDKTPGHGPNGDCWIWTGELDKDGYGRFRVNKKRVRIHVYSYQINCGEVPKGICVCHSCDVRNCANPAHLWLGDSPANTADMISKGRDRYLVGADHPRSKLTEAQALSILRDDRMQTEIAAEYGVSKATICLLKTRKTWKHLTP